MVAVAPVNTNGLPEQIEVFGPAYAVAAGQIFNTIKSLTAGQLPLPVAVRVNCTCPVAISAALGV